MPINLKTPVVESREQRLGTVIGWQGPASDLAAESCFARGGGCGQKARRACVTRDAAAESVVRRPSQLRIRSAALRRRSSAPGVWSMA